MPDIHIEAFLFRSLYKDIPSKYVLCVFIMSRFENMARANANIITHYKL